jgi:hypothetical protein
MTLRRTFGLSALGSQGIDIDREPEQPIRRNGKSATTDAMRSAIASP